MVTYVPDDVWSPASALGVAGVSVGSFGVFVRYQDQPSLFLEQTTLHELDHRVWQGRMGLIPWVMTYYDEMLVEWAHYGGNYWTGPYVTNSWEQSAHRMAGEPQDPAPTPWWIWDVISDLATNIIGFH